jgi:hypothetical protein
LASNSANRRPPGNGSSPAEPDDRPAGKRLWLGRWVIVLAIFAFLGVYTAQLAAGSGMLFTVLISTAAMGVVGLASLGVRQMILYSAERERAEDVLNQAGRTRRTPNDDTSGESANG